MPFCITYTNNFRSTLQAVCDKVNKRRGGHFMKIIALAAFAALILLSACDSESDGTDAAPRPVDAWTPFVQVLPPQGVWDVQLGDAEIIPLEAETSTRALRRGDLIYYETNRIYNFFGTNMGLFDREVDFPEFFGGRQWLWFGQIPQYVIVLIVEGHEDEAEEFLTYIEDFRTVRVSSSNISYNEFLYVFDQILNSQVSPNPWRTTWVNVLEQKIRVTLINYSEEEIVFFREFVSDSPLIKFKCAYEIYGEIIMARFWTNRPMLINELDSISISVQVENILDLHRNIMQGAYDFMFSVYNNSEYSYQVLYSYMAAFMNGRWVYLLTITNSFDTELKPGYSHSIVPTSFTRQIDGPYKLVFILSEPYEQGITHRLEYVFER